MPSSHIPDALVVGFDDDHAVANAGLLLPATLAQRLGIEQVVDQLVDLGGRPGAHRPGRKVLTLVHAILAGADCIDAGVLACPGMEGEKVPVPIVSLPAGGRPQAALQAGLEIVWRVLMADPRPSKL